MLTRDVEINDSHLNELIVEKHIAFLQGYAKSKDNYEQIMVEYLRMSGMYWGLTALRLMGIQPTAEERKEMIEFIKACQSSETGGISASVGHDPHILYTLSAVQILVLFDALSEIDADKIVKYIKGLQQEDGSFWGDEWGEVDTRFSFCAIACLALLNRLDEINVDKAVEFILSCRNAIDGGFGSKPGSESHAGLVYCCLGSLAITGQLDKIDADLLGWWLAERQLPSGGLNGRPEKLPDLCYSWWVLASLKILGRLHWIDRRKLIRFITACQDEETGGFSDRPSNLVDPFHTLFGVAGLSLLAHDEVDRCSVDNDNEESSQADDDDDEDEDMNGPASEASAASSSRAQSTRSPKRQKTVTFEEITSKIGKVNPVFCMPQEVIDATVKIHPQLLTI